MILTGVNGVLNDFFCITQQTAAYFGLRGRAVLSDFREHFLATTDARPIEESRADPSNGDDLLVGLAFSGGGRGMLIGPLRIVVNVAQLAREVVHSASAAKPLH